MQMDAPSVAQDRKQGSLTTLTSTKRNVQSGVNRQIQDFNLNNHMEDQQRVQTQYQPVQNNNVVVVSSDQIVHQTSTPISQFSGIIPFDGSGGARVVNIVSNDNSMPMLISNISQQNRTLTPTLPMQGKPCTTPDTSLS